MAWKWIASPNFTKGRGGYKPEIIVIHIMAGTLDGTNNWFSQPASQVSAHFGIGKQGEVVNYVDTTNSAWHCGVVKSPSIPLKKTIWGGFVNPNYYSVGIEHEGTDSVEITEAEYLASAKVIKYISDKWGIPIDRKHIVKHSEIYVGHNCPNKAINLDKLIEIAKKQ